MIRVACGSAALGEASPGATSRILSAEAESIFLYTWEETAETTEPIAAPIREPATPITDESRNTVAAAKAPAITWARDKSSNKVANLPFSEPFCVVMAKLPFPHPQASSLKPARKAIHALFTHS